jgi:L-ribulose-5-phosphate 3-epimerase
MNPLGVMQGRLLPKYQGRYQAHPIGYWQDEFLIASKLGLDCIEFIFDYNDYENSPLLTTQGQKQIRSISEQARIRVFSVCADYFMEAPLSSEDEKSAQKSLEVLNKLISSAAELGVKNIVIPCVDKSSIQDEYIRDKLIEVLRSIIPEVEKCEINLSLESDLNPKQLNNLLDQIPSEYLTVNYDIGNSAALGYDYRDELHSYVDRISDIHIKDRELGGGSVLLGSGNADIPGFFNYLRKFNYNGPFIMQAYRDNNGINIFKQQLGWLNQKLKENYYVT